MLLSRGKNRKKRFFLKNMQPGASAGIRKSQFFRPVPSEELKKSKNLHSRACIPAERHYIKKHDAGKPQHLMQPRGVMVAQVILVHLVEVRILAGLPFFFALLKLLSFKRVFYPVRQMIGAHLGHKWGTNGSQARICGDTINVVYDAQRENALFQIPDSSEVLTPDGSQ